MSLLPHVLAADVHRLRVTIALWVSVLLVETIVGQAATFFPDMSERFMTLMYAERLLFFATTLLAWAIVPLVLHLHPAVGTQAFWMTRPIPPLTLAAAKVVLLAVLFVGVPLAIEQVVMAVHGVPGADMGRVGLQTAIYRGAIMAALAAPAALTPNLARFALLCGGVVFGVALLPVLLMSLDALMSSPEAPRLVAAMTMGSALDVPVLPPDSTSQIVAVTLLLLLGVLSVAIQYQRRRVRETVAVLVAGVVIVYLVSTNWPWPARRASIAPPGWATSSGALQLAANVATMRFNPPNEMQHGEPRWVVHAPLTMTPAPAGWIATARVLSASFTIEKEVLSTTNDFPASAVLPDGSGHPPGPTALQRALEVNHVLEWGLLNAPKEFSFMRLQLPADVVSRANVRTGIFSGEFSVDLTRLGVASVMSLGRGSFQDGAYSVTIQDLRQTPTGLLVHARMVTLATVFDRRPRPAYAYFLRNRPRGEAIRGATSGGSLHFSVGAFAVGFSGGGNSGGFSAHSESLVFDGRDPNTPDSRMLITPEWLRDAEFVVLRATHEGSLRRTLEIRDFPLRH